jgi:hypothetical protein
MVAVLSGYRYERLFCSSGNAGSIGAVRVTGKPGSISIVRATGVTGTASATRLTRAASQPERSRADQYRFR